MLKTKSNSFYVLLILVICLLLSACSSPVPTEATTYIARINHAPESARVGIVIEDGKFVLYICSLDDAFNLSTARWFTNDLQADGTVAGISPDGVKVNGSINKDSFTGIITNLQGEVITFRGLSVPTGGPVGLYRGVGDYDGQEVIVGAIVDTDLAFAATVQVKGRTEFITPVLTPPLYIDNSTLRITIGDLNQKITALLISTLVSLDI
jgi:hypothetical protein